MILSSNSGDNTRYCGSAWRARFLRAPKIALELARREDFVPLSELATVRLGLKTGADDFFFLERVTIAHREKDLLPARKSIQVKGLNGWKGELPLSDLRPAVLNPHQLIVEDERLYSVPRDTGWYYLFPSATSKKFGVREYVKLAELEGISEKSLVKSNADDTTWYRQTRPLIASPWILPYNSAYEYGAWANPFGAVLNGRLLGVDPLVTESSEMLGAVLNSIFALLGRLVEGVSTGTEGAIDVGPPAARRIMLPDIRKFSESSRQSIADALTKIRQSNLMPAAPDWEGNVPELRRELDTAILEALGSTKGQAIAYLERLYVGYGRWRKNVEGVEAQMRLNRRNMAASGQNRDQKPTEATGKRVWEEIEHLFPLFPAAYLANSDVLEIVGIPSSATIPTEKPLFDSGVIQTKTRAIDLGSFERVRYIGMLKVIGLSRVFEVPLSEDRCKAIVDLFELKQVEFRAASFENAMKYTSSKESAKEICAIAEKYWLLTCRKSVLKKESGSKSSAKKSGLQS